MILHLSVLLGPQTCRISDSDMWLYVNCGLQTNAPNPFTYWYLELLTVSVTFAAFAKKANIANNDVKTNFFITTKIFKVGYLIKTGVKKR